MSSVLQINVGLNPVVVWNGRQATAVNSLLLWNSDTTNTIYIGSESNISSSSPNTIPLPPNGSISVDPASPWWVVGAVAGIAPLVVLPNGQNFFLGFTQGQGNLAIPQFQSPGYDSATGQGWALYQNGDASFNQVTITVQADGIAVLIYYPTPGPGNLIGSWTASPTATTDVYGNTIPPGLYVNNGTLAGVTLNSPAMVGGTILNTLLNASTITQSNITAGTSYEQTITFDTGGGVLLCYATSVFTVVNSTNGTYQVTLPADVTTINNAYCIGGGAAGDGGSTSEGGNGGGGGEHAGETNYTPSVNPFSYTVGAGGSSSTTGNGHGSNGGNSAIDVAVNGILAYGGLGNGAGGSGSTNSIEYAGGNGGPSNGDSGGGGGGASGGNPGIGDNGAAPSGSTGGAGGNYGFVGGGGNGGDDGDNGGDGGVPGGGGGGAGQGTSTSGSLTKTYTPVWCGSYYGPDATGGNANQGRSNSIMYQGGETSDGGEYNGNQRCCFAFNRDQIAEDFSGYTMTEVTLTATNLHSWYDSGMTVLIDEFAGLPGSAPGSYPSGAYNSTDASGTVGEGDTADFGLGSAAANRIVTGATNGFGFGYEVAADHPYNLDYYGFFSASSISITLKGQISESGSNTSGTGTDGEVGFTYVTSQSLVCSLSPVAGSDSGGNSYGIGYTGPIQSFDPNQVPAAVEEWHKLTLLNGWTAQGFARYKLIGYNLMLLELQINDSSATSGTIAEMPSGYIATTSQFFPIGQFSNASGTPGKTWIMQAGTGAGGALNILDWTKQSEQFMGNYFISLD